MLIERPCVLHLEQVPAGNVLGESQPLAPRPHSALEDVRPLRPDTACSRLPLHESSAPLGRRQSDKRAPLALARKLNGSICEYWRLKRSSERDRSRRRLSKAAGTNLSCHIMITSIHPLIYSYNAPP